MGSQGALYGPVEDPLNKSEDTGPRVKSGPRFCNDVSVPQVGAEHPTSHHHPAASPRRPTRRISTICMAQRVGGDSAYGGQGLL